MDLNVSIVAALTCSERRHKCSDRKRLGRIRFLVGPNALLYKHNVQKSNDVKLCIRNGFA